MQRLATSPVLYAKRGVPDFWDPYKLRHGWPKYQGFYAHSREAGQKRMLYKDRTYRVASYECGPRNLEILLLKNLDGLGTLGEVCTIPKIKARKLLERNLVTHATPENVKFFQYRFKEEFAKL